MNKKIKMTIVIGVALAVVAGLLSEAYAFFSYVREGTKTSTLTAGAIKFHFQEGTNEISIEDSLPMIDSEGKELTDYFEFTITSDTPTGISIPYQITGRKVDPDNVYDGIKVYLTEVNEVNNEEVETQVAFGLYSSFTTVTHNNNTEALIYSGTVPANSSNYSQKYRLRIWYDNDKFFTTTTDQQGHKIHPYNGTTFGVKINVYANGTVAS